MCLFSKLGLFFFFKLCCVFISLVLESRGYCIVVVSWLLTAVASHCGVQVLGHQASGVAAHELSICASRA